MEHSLPLWSLTHRRLSDRTKLVDLVGNVLPLNFRRPCFHDLCPEDADVLVCPGFIATSFRLHLRELDHLVSGLEMLTRLISDFEASQMSLIESASNSLR